MRRRPYSREPFGGYGARDLPGGAEQRGRRQVLPLLPMSPGLSLMTMSLALRSKILLTTALCMRPQDIRELQPFLRTPGARRR